MSTNLQRQGAAWRATIVGLTISLSLLISVEAHAQGAEVSAALDIVVKTISGLSSWIDEHSDDCAASTLAAAWGSDCNLSQEECTETGRTSAECTTVRSNACGIGVGHAFSAKSIFGAWAGRTIKVEAAAVPMPWHTPPDRHGAKGWSRSSVNGSSRARTEETPPSLLPPTVSLASAGSRTASSSNLLDTWPDGTVLVSVEIDTLTISTLMSDSRSSTFNAELEVDGQPVWSTSASLDGFGNLSAQGNIPANAFTLTPNGANGTWDAQLLNYVFEFPVDTLATSVTIDSVDVAIHFDATGSAEGTNESDGFNPVPVPVPLDQTRLTDPNGVPTLAGEYVQITSPVTVLSDPANLSPILDTDVTDGNVALGILDPFHAPEWLAGELIQLTGMVTHHEGRTVLAEVEAILLASGQPLPEPAEMPVADAHANGEQLEGMPIELCGLSLVDPGAWPAPSDDGVVRVSDGGDEIDVWIATPTGIGGTPPPAEPFDLIGTLSQHQPAGPPYTGGYIVRLTSANYLGACTTPAQHVKDHDVGNMILTITDHGTLGWDDETQSLGSGLVFPAAGSNSLYIGSVWVAQGTNGVANNDYTADPEREWVVEVEPDGKPAEVQGPADQVIVSGYNDDDSPDPFDLYIRQESWAFDSNSPDDDFVIVRYFIHNRSDSDLTDLRAGLFLDLDIENAGDDTGDSDEARKTTYMKDDVSGIHVGVRLLEGDETPDPLSNQSLIHNPTFVYPSLYILDVDKFGFLSGSDPTYQVPQSTGPDDWSLLVAAGPFTLAPQDSNEVAFAIVGGESLGDLLANADRAQQAYAPTTGVERGDQPGLRVTRLMPNTPNPFNPQTTVRFDLAQPADVKLMVYSPMGRVVRTLLRGLREAGQHEMVWDGRNDSGGQVASGVYFLRLDAGPVTESRRMLMVK
jgi:hypothetical protein